MGSLLRRCKNQKAGYFYILTLALLLIPASFVPMLISEAEVPTDEATWSACCDHRDCQEAKINVAYQAGDLAKVAIGAYPIFELEAAKIFHSTNGRSYFCRSDVSKVPDRENTRCVFHDRPSYVKTDGL